MIFENFEFKNSSGRNYKSGGFYHVSTLFLHGQKLHIETCQYLNRTWEQYPFQTSMIKCIEKCILKYPDLNFTNLLKHIKNEA